MTQPDIILFTYDISVFGRKVEWYLNLRGIKYYKNPTRDRLPREQLAELGIKYRRIPVVAIGRDVYCDTRLILDKLEELFPENRLGAKAPFERGIEYLLENWVLDAGPFWRTSALIPPTAEVMNDPQWIKDRTEMTGNQFNKTTLARARPEALVHTRMYFHMLEKTLMGDGRPFVLNTSTPTLADIHGIWVWDWTLNPSMNMEAFLEKDVINEQSFPNMFAWVDRFRRHMAVAVEQNGPPQMLSDREAVDKILASEYTEPEGEIDPVDPLKLTKGQTVEVFPTDSGSAHRDAGELVSITVKEVVIKSAVPNGRGHLRLHFPRNNFRVKVAQAAKI